MTALGISGSLPFYKCPTASYVHLLIMGLSISISFPFFHKTHSLSVTRYQNQAKEQSMEMKLLEILGNFIGGPQISFCVYLGKILSVSALKIKFSEANEPR